MSVIFRNNTSLIIFIVLVVILISCPPIQTSKDDPFQDVKAIGVYANGTMLFKVKDSLHLIYPNGTSHSIPKIHCKQCHYHLLNSNNVIIEKHNHNVVSIWKENKILKSFKYDKLNIGEKNDRFLIMRHNKFTEYRIIDHDDGVNITKKRLHFNNFNERHKEHKEHKEHKITEIFSLDDAWGIISSEEKKSFFSIIQTKSENKTLTTKELKQFAGPSKCITTNQTTSNDIKQTNDTQYYCLYRTHTHRLKLVNIKNLSSNDNTFNLTSTDLFQDNISFETKTLIHIMPNVGFLVKATAKLNPKYYIFNIFEIDYSNHNNAFGERIIDNHDNDLIDDFFIFPNNTVIQIRMNGTHALNDLSSIIPKNNPYKNTHIKSVYPSNNVDIGTTTLNITFLNAIALTNTAANISIYYETGINNNTLLRHMFLCVRPHCIISDNSLSLTADIPEFTFNMPNANYYVEIDDGFVKYKYDDITIPGIKVKNWNITTLSTESKCSNKDDNFKLGELRFNSNGTEEFRKLPDAVKDYFSDQMRIELSKNIPVDDSRIKINDKKYEFDTVSSVNLYFSIQINPPNEGSSFNKKCSEEVFEDLNSLIRTSKDFITNLDLNYFTKNIDKDYGFQESSTIEKLIASFKNFIENRQYLIIIIVCSILTMLYFYGRYKNKKGTNIIVFKVALIIIDLINDIRFINKLKTISSNLFIPSVLFLLFPFILNVFFAIAIFKFEIQNSINSEWFKNYIKPVAIATILSSGDIELLHIFDSNFGGFKIFSLKFSSETLNLIFWGGFSNIILENLPQLIIQILYATIKSSSGIIDVSSLFTLIISIIVFLVSVIECSYHILMNNKNGNHQSDYIVERDIKH
ncbi:unnamed protein product [Rhizophagus irregularis]|nr:unnamed protein product [Rhizophagus irregularis]